MFLTRKRQPRSNVNLSVLKATTLAPGNLIPISTTRVYAGDKLPVNPSGFVQAMPMKAPLVNGFKIAFEYFFIPDRIYNVDLSMNFTGVTNEPEKVYYPRIFPYSDETAFPEGHDVDTINAFTLPAITIQEDEVLGLDVWEKFERQVVTPGSLADYLGLHSGFVPAKIFNPEDLPDPDKEYPGVVNAIPALGYVDIFLNYYANQQLPKVYCSEKNGEGTWFKGLSGLYSYPLARLQDYMRAIKTSNDPVNSVQKAIDDFGGSDGVKLLSWDWFASRLSIFQRAYPDYSIETWLNSSGYVANEIKVDLEESGNTQSISIRDISFQSHVQRWLDLALAGGSRYSDYLNAEFDVKPPKNCTCPIFLGSDRQYLGSKVLYQTTGFDNPDSPLGSFAGQSSGGETFKTRRYKFNENGYFMVIASLVPDVIYKNYMPNYLEEMSLADTYVPALDNIAMQPMFQRTLDDSSSLFSEPIRGGEVSSWADNEVGDDVAMESADAVQITRVLSNYRSTAVGYQPAWSHLTYDISKVHGLLGTDYAFWNLIRRYSTDHPKEFDTWITDNLEILQRDYNWSDTQAATIRAFFINNGYQFNFDAYVDPNAYNSSFANVAHGAQNFVLTYSHNCIASRLKAKVNTQSII